MKQTLSPKILFGVFGFAILLMVITGLTKDGLYVLLALGLVMAGWPIFLIFGAIDSYRNRHFNKFRREFESIGFVFLGPKEMTAHPGGPKAKIQNDRFCTMFENEVKCFKTKSVILRQDGIPYRHLEGASNTRYLVAYDPESAKFGLFKRAD